MIKNPTPFSLALFCALSFVFHSAPGHGAPLNPPAQFDETTVRRLLKAIDQPRNASYLKVLYFSSHAQPKFPQQKAWQLLQKQLVLEKPGTKRWFILQDIRGFVGLRLAFTDKKTGFAAYRQIFARAADAAPNHADYYLKESVTEFINSVPLFAATKIPDSLEMNSTISSAWAAFVESEKQGEKFAYLKPDWALAFEMNGLPTPLIALVKTELSDKSTPHTFAILAGAAHILSFDEGDQDIEVWKEAKDMRPLNEKGELDKAALGAVYNDLAETLNSKNHTGEAIQMAKERIAKTGEGRAQLLRLWNFQNDKSVAGVVSGLCRPDADEAEIVSVSDVLYNEGYDADRLIIWNSTVLQQAVKLQEFYLHHRQKRTPTTELILRLQLASILHLLHQDSKAIDVLQVNWPQGSDEKITSLLEEMGKKRASLEQFVAAQRAAKAKSHH